MGSILSCLEAALLAMPLNTEMLPLKNVDMGAM